MTRRQLWGGRFTEPPAQVLRAFNDSFGFDQALLGEDVRGSIAWAEALGRAGVLASGEVKKLVAGLAEIGAEVSRTGVPPDADDEDVHSFVEARLAAKVGPLAGKLHTGRSRNDQVATDFRLYLKEALAEGAAAARAFALALARRAEAEAASPMPGYTHLKRAEPVTFGHWCLAYVEMLRRDASRFDNAASRADECPLGSGALSGTPLPVDRETLARSLGFLRPTANSLDAVSDRDAAAEYLFASALLLVHLSRLGEDLIAFTSDEFGFATLPDALATGSSRMPQKKNPDLLELARGHAGRAIGDLTGLLAVLKGLPLAYDKDLQLDKEPVFRVRGVLGAALPALTGIVEGLRLDHERMARAASDDRLLATELADALAKRGMPFREAHEIVGRRIAEAEALGTTLAALGPSKEITAQDLQALDVRRALAKRDVTGGTAPRQVARAAKSAVRRLAGGAGMRLPKGFLASGVRAGIRKKRPDVALIVAEKGANAAALFTKNRFQAASVVLGRRDLARSGGRVRAVVVNAGCANAVTGKPGLDATRRVRDGAAALFGFPKEEVLVSSTGVIGVVLPDAKIRAALPDAKWRLSSSGLDAASHAILTTDVGPKVAQASFAWMGRRGRVVGLAKGAGMIHPNMATMLAFVMTDVPATPAYLKAALREAADASFHLISVDGDTSTNDTVLLMASGALPGPELSAKDDGPEFRKALGEVCRTLAWKMVRDGEGATRVLDITVTGARTEAEAKAAAHAVATSPLVKTALHGGDPNWGRILAAVGRSGARFSEKRVSLRLGKLTLVKNGTPAPYREKDAVRVFRRERVPVVVDLGAGTATASKLASDLGHDYVSLNTDYRS